MDEWSEGINEWTECMNGVDDCMKENVLNIVMF